MYAGRVFYFFIITNQMIIRKCRIRLFLLNTNFRTFQCLSVMRMIHVTNKLNGFNVQNN